MYGSSGQHRCNTADTNQIVESRKTTMSVGKVHQLIFGQPLALADCASTDVDDGINSISNTKVADNFGNKPNAI